MQFFRICFCISRRRFFFLASFSFFSRIFFASVLPSVFFLLWQSVYTFVSHAPFLGGGGGGGGVANAFFLHRIFCSLNLHSPPPGPSISFI